jgi:nicotinamide-nucleotide amidase
MNVEIITIGDEILIGQITDTNSAWIGQTFNREGLDVVHIQSISDRKDAIKQAVSRAFERADLVIMTGGLGPTQDDITKETLCEYFESELVLNEEVLQHLEQIFHNRGRKLLDINKGQAMIPNKCEVLFNVRGTAPGMLFKQGKKWLASMPGVPYEMKHIISNELLPSIRAAFKLEPIYHKTITTIGVPESLLAKKLSHIVDKLPSYIRPAYLPNLNLVRFRLSSRGGEDSVDETNHFMQEIIDYLGHDIVLSKEGLRPAELNFNLLKDRGLKMTMAESCTGGYVASQLTQLEGASSIFKGSLVAYDYDVKTTELGVPEEVLLKTGAVSRETVTFMCEKVRTKYKSDVGIGISGIAGPGGGTEDKPVGTVYIGVTDGESTFVKCFHFHGKREQIIEKTSNQAYNLARKLILNLL